MTEPTDPSEHASTSPTPPALIRVGVLVLSGIALVSHLAGIVAATGSFAATLWGMLGFEVIGVVAGVLGVLAGLGRFRSGYGLAVLCVAGTVFTTAIFGLYLDARGNAQTPEAQSIVKYAIAGRLALAGALAGLAGLAVLARDGRSWGLLIKGALLLAPVLGILAWVGVTRASALRTPLEGILAPARTVGVVLASMVLMVVFAVGAHLCIRAFEITRPDDAEPADD